MEETLRAKIRERLTAGMLPRKPPQKVWGGRGTRRQCAACDAIISDAEIEIEVEVEIDTSPGHLFFHPRCRVLWEEERQAG
jgi:hypothetical protein